MSSAVKYGPLTVFLFIGLFYCLPGKGQSIFLEEDFDSWFSSCAPGWTCGQAKNCSGIACQWERQDQLPSAGSPSTLDCGGGGFYARVHSSGLAPGEEPSLLSPLIDLSIHTDSTDLLWFFCMINAGLGNTDSDTLWLDASADAGSTWTPVWFNDSVYQSWTPQRVVLPRSFYTEDFRFRFRASSNFSQGDIGVDNVELREEFPSCQAAPSNIAVKGDTLICANANSDPLFLSTDYVGRANYQFALTDSLNRIISIFAGNSLEADQLPEGVYRLWGISYSGALTYFPLQDLGSISAGQCLVISTNSIRLEIYQPRLSIGIQSAYNGFEVSHFGGRDGKAKVEVSGGVAPYEIIWETPTPIFGPQANVLPAGTFDIRVKDNLGCEIRGSLTLNQPDSLQLRLEVLEAPICPSDSQGRLSSIVSGGVAPYTWSWSSGDSSEQVNGLPAGSYILKLTDANGHSKVDSISLGNGLPMEVSFEIDSPICSALSLSEVEVRVEGGSPPYQYLWSDGARVSSRVDLPVGVYQLNVEDLNGCEVSKEIDIFVNEDTLSLQGMVMGISCAGDSLGDILLEIAGGHPPYQIAWNNGESGPGLWSQPPGTYSVRVEDQAGCNSEKSFVLAPPPALEVKANVVADRGDQSGSLELEVRGGSPPYFIEWQNGSQGPALDSLASGEYSFSIIDEKGCLLDSTLLLPYDPSLALPCQNLELGFSPNGDGINDFFEIPCLESYPRNNLEIFNRWGQVLYQTQNYKQDWEGNVDGKALPKGSYFWVATLYIGTRIIQLNGTLSLIR